MTVYIYSTLANDNKYTVYTKGGADLPSVEKQIHIKGGAGVADKRGDTKYGMLTEITEEEYKALQTVHSFQRHVENGFIYASETKVDPEAAAADMTGRDESAPLVDQDFDQDVASGKIKSAPTTGGKRK